MAAPVLPKPGTPAKPINVLARSLYNDAKAHATSGHWPNWENLDDADQRTWSNRACRIRDDLGDALRETYPDQVTTTGYDSADHTPAGATITRVYFCEPGHGTPAADNAEYATYDEALAAAITRHEAAEARHRSFHEGTNQMGTYLPLPERFCIDTRWTLSWPVDRAAGRFTSGTDTVAKRTTYATLDAGREHLARIKRYAPVGAY